MNSRIPGSGVSNRNPFGPVWAQGKAPVQSQEQQVQDSLFGKPKPKVIDVEDADTAAQMARLNAYRKRLAVLAGDAPEDYSLKLAAGTIAMIDQQGVIYVGRRFLMAHVDALDVQVGVLAHEVGHRPKRWAEYKTHAPLTQEELNHLCRTEETRADYFSGRALAELGMSPVGLVAFLKAIQTHPHAQYFSAELRGQVIMEAFENASRQAADRKKFFPEFARAQDIKGDLGSG